MFSGIISAVGSITHVETLSDGVRLTVDNQELDLTDVKLGDSIAHNGVCLTVIDKTGQLTRCDVSAETLRCSVGLQRGDTVNLEKALRADDRLGGHIVSGHVDGIGEVLSLASSGDNHQLDIRAPAELAGYIAKKGSITVNGVSLTVNAVSQRDFSINLIPHTFTNTNLHQLTNGTLVNLEIDMIARYVERLTQYRQDAAQ